MEAILPLASFAFASSITPGPNNLMLASSAIGYGLRRTLPVLLGVVLGFWGLILLCGLGVGALIASVPAATLTLKVLGTGYLFYLAWKIFNNPVSEISASQSKPMSVLGAAAFQLTNPKAWIMALTAVSAFMPNFGTDFSALLWVVGIFGLVNLPCVSAWVLLGTGIRRWLTNARMQILFSRGIAILMLYAAATIWL